MVKSGETAKGNIPQDQACQRHKLIFQHINSQNIVEMSETKWYKSGRHCSTQWQELLGPYKYITVITFVKWTFYLKEDIAEGSIYHRDGMRFREHYYGMLYRGLFHISEFIFSITNGNFTVYNLYCQLVSGRNQTFRFLYHILIYTFRFRSYL